MTTLLVDPQGVPDPHTPIDTAYRQNSPVPTVADPTVGPPVWDTEEAADLHVTAIVDVTHDVRTFVLQHPAGRLFHFEPGQFVTLEVWLEGRMVERSYTIVDVTHDVRTHCVSPSRRCRADWPRPGCTSRSSRATPFG
ncbi:FAD-binding oxidoreductase [Brevibacterium litoralis]|uniref:FAD-binding oxidoreductase n=1 Tax=Brevibacterium litoralis TaxID=3138935 RepID=UPI0032EED012